MSEKSDELLAVVCYYQQMLKKHHRRLASLDRRGAPEEQREDSYRSIRKYEIVLAALTKPSAPVWLPIETAPKDGTEILGWREDCGTLLIRWTSPEAFLNDNEITELGESAFEPDWFVADFMCGCRLDGDLMPTHWQHLPPPPHNDSPCG